MRWKRWWALMRCSALKLSKLKMLEKTLLTCSSWSYYVHPVKWKKAQLKNELTSASEEAQVRAWLVN
eukprot:CAMPEP_0174239714 /NCGR_PEP_ID=MMETSP0417-20130205/15775_1 /TAXON_ID=242541 /ORGANISM="Mayorella sp, Strain BSH-02190019" /LENGTH=66 /DNA_ID=CAMNT_0015318681 /DNA_START=1 /DNA_END=198 /DNA_ORIENTATION=+